MFRQTYGNSCVWVMALVVVVASVSRESAFAQVSESALRFYGTGVGPPGQQDRVRIPIDDNAPGPDASAPCDVGAGGFTLDFWIRGNLADNPATGAAGDVDLPGNPWINGNIIIDRDIWASGPGSNADWGTSIVDGFIRFGTGANGDDAESTIEGDVNVLDGQWHHVALVRDAATGRKRIFVDGILDFESTTNLSNDDISYPGSGVSNPSTPWNPYIVLAAEKHDAGPAFPSFNGYLDELRIWDVALTQAQLLRVYDRVIHPATPGLVAYYRFEEGAGTFIADSSAAASPAGELIAGIPGNGEWVARTANPLNTAPLRSGSLPPGFVRTAIVDVGLNEPTVIEFAPDGRLFIAERGGRILIHQGGQMLGAPLIQVSADNVLGERGLVGMAIDPEFATNGYLYVYYTRAITPEISRNRVSRFTVIGNAADPATEFVVWENPDPANYFHHGGCIAVGPDGNLYIATGDQFDVNNSQNLSNQHGKVLRVRRDGAIPSDNPFVGVPGASPAIWSYGLRNPFRFAFDSASGRLWIGDVGGNTDVSWEELNLGSPGANYGWVLQEGPVCYAADCSSIVFPRYSYQHNDPNYYIAEPEAAIMCGPAYRASVFPPPYQGNLFVADFANGWIRRLILGDQGQVLADPLFMDAPSAGTILDMEVGPDGALYFVNVGVDNIGQVDQPAVYSVAYVGVSNQPPVVAAAADVTAGQVPLTVVFSSAGTIDPDNGPQPLTYDWTFGDGGASNQPNPTHVYSAPGVYLARLTVSDGAAQAQSASIQIIVGNPPNPTILTPSPGTTYRAGDVIQFSGEAVDLEDGALPPSAFTWLVVLRHHSHVHPFYGPVSGVTGGSFTVPVSGHGPEDTFFEIQLSVVDSDGLPGAVSRPLDPVISTIVFDTAPSGIPIILDGKSVATPRSYDSLSGFQHQVEAQESFVLGGVPHVFVCWSDGGDRAHVFVAPEGGGTLTASYSGSAGGPQVFNVAVPAADRNADYWPPAGQAYANFYDAFGLCVGADGGGQYEIGLEFPLAVPQGSMILAAEIRVTATNDQLGGVQSVINGYDLSTAPPFVVGSPTPISAFAPLTAASVSWVMPSFAPGQDYLTPDLSVIVQEVVDRPDWVAGNFIGFVIDPGTTLPDNWRCIRNLASGQPAALSVLVVAPVPPLPADIDGDGDQDVTDLSAFVAVLVGVAVDCLHVIRSDINGDGSPDGEDIQAFVDALLLP